MDEETYAWYIARVLEEKKRIKNSSDFTADEKKMYIRGLIFVSKRFRGQRLKPCADFIRRVLTFR